VLVIQVFTKAIAALVKRATRAPQPA